MMCWQRSVFFAQWIAHRIVFNRPKINFGAPKNDEKHLFKMPSTDRSGFKFRTRPRAYFKEEEQLSVYDFLFLKKIGLKIIFGD